MKKKVPWKWSALVAPAIVEEVARAGPVLWLVPKIERKPTLRQSNTSAPIEQLFASPLRPLSPLKRYTDHKKNWQNKRELSHSHSRTLTSTQSKACVWQRGRAFNLDNIVVSSGAKQVVAVAKFDLSNAQLRVRA